MKTVLIILLCSVWSFAMAQTEQGSYTIFSDRSYSQVNTYASFDGSMFYVNEALIGSVGGTVGLTINHAFSIGPTGAYIFESTNEPVLIIPPGYHNYVIKKYFWYLGMMMESTLFPRAPLHITIPMMIGGGQRSYHIQETNEMWNYYAQSLSCENFFITSVGARLEINIADGFRFSIGPSYKYATNLTFLTGFSLDMSIKIGSF